MSGSLTSRMVSGVKRGIQKVVLIHKRSWMDRYLEEEGQKEFSSEASNHLPLDLRWERLRDRHDTHMKSVEKVREILHRRLPDAAALRVMRREEMDAETVAEADLVVCVGGDGTVLQTSHHLGSNVPLLGVNSDPDTGHDVELDDYDTRRSVGALCCCTSSDFEGYFERVLSGAVLPSERGRIMVTLKGAHKGEETSTLLRTYGLNDVLIAHANPAAVSRFRLSLWEGSKNVPTLSEEDEEHTFAAIAAQQRLFREQVRSSGLRICTATGSTGAMKSAGGLPMTVDSPSFPGCNGMLQYMVREPMNLKQGQLIRGMLNRDQSLRLRWNATDGSIFIDGHYVSTPISLGDRIVLTGAAPRLLLYS